MLSVSNLTNLNLAQVQLCFCPVLLQGHLVMITLWVVYVGGLAPLHVTIPALSWPLNRHKYI